MARTQFRGPRRKTQWMGMGDSAGNVNLPGLLSVGTAAKVVLSANFIGSGGAGIVDEETTITRMIGQYTASVSSTTALTTGTIALGMAVVRAEAFAAGVAALPSPISDPDFEWLYYGSVILRNPNLVFQDGPAASIVVPFDVRGQRIVRAGQTVVWIGEAEISTIFTGVTGRYLVKLT